MSDSKSTKNKHLTLGDRQEIMECLDKGITFKAIAGRVGKDPTTISKEVKKHLAVRPTDVMTMNSDGTHVDGRVCPNLLKAPFVCNPCKKKRRDCPYDKQFYIAKHAHNDYGALLSEAREGIPLNKEEFWDADATIAMCIKNGQRLYHIMETNDIGFSKSTAYRHLHNGYPSVSKMDFPRVVKFKPRKQHRADCVPKAVRAGRAYGDFLYYIGEHGIVSWVGMDTVIGRPGGKTIMTFDFTSCNFMFGLPLDGKTAGEASSRIRSLKAALGENDIRFGEIIPLPLTDNGCEFANVRAFTDDLEGAAETAMFFCDPYCSSQKPKVEKNHTLFRDIVPKGESFDCFTQATVDGIFPHAGGIKRKIFNGKSPFEMFSFLFGSEMPALLGIREVPAADVIQSPLLMKHIAHTFIAGQDGGVLP
jgi:IS30 family transposase